MKTTLILQRVFFVSGCIAMLVVSAMQTWGACTTPPPGVVVWWPAEGWANDLMATNPSYLNGGVLFGTGKVGRCFWFDGVDDSVESRTPALTNILNNFTYEFWAYPNRARNVTAEGTSGISGTSGQRYAIGPEHGGDANNVGVGISVGTNGVSVFEHAANYLPSLLVFETNITDWVHIAVVYENRQPRLYLNGELVRTGLTSQRTTVLASKTLGGLSNYGPYGGMLDEVTLYDRSLSEAEIQNIYAAGSTGKCRPDCVEVPAGGLAWWTADYHASDVVGVYRLEFILGP